MAEDWVADHGGEIARRDMMKKAALAAGITAATWAAPKVEGLGLKQDAAGAASCTTANANIAWASNVCGNAGTDCISGMGNSSGSSCTCVAANYATGTIVTTPGGAAMASVNVPATNTGLVNVPVSFTGVDSPFVSCVVTGFTAAENTANCTISSDFNATAVDYDIDCNTGDPVANFSVAITCTCS